MQRPARGRQGVEPLGNFGIFLQDGGMVGLDSGIEDQSAYDIPSVSMRRTPQSRKRRQQDWCE